MKLSVLKLKVSNYVKRPFKKLYFQTEVLVSIQTPSSCILHLSTQQIYSSKLMEKNLESILTSFNYVATFLLSDVGKIFKFNLDSVYILSLELPSWSKSS